ncbi:hypothetical protein B0H14DRAFT_2612085 [Mycena olivaceomarginata]|nr:hypothetical protein B0H14DRAFT_2612085 [Mycena olivaceomarginata]
MSPLNLSPIIAQRGFLGHYFLARLPRLLFRLQAGGVREGEREKEGGVGGRRRERERERGRGRERSVASRIRIDSSTSSPWRDKRPANIEVSPRQAAPKESKEKNHHADSVLTIHPPNLRLQLVQHVHLLHEVLVHGSHLVELLLGAVRAQGWPGGGQGKVGREGKKVGKAWQGDQGEDGRGMEGGERGRRLGGKREDKEEAGSGIEESEGGELGGRAKEKAQAELRARKAGGRVEGKEGGGLGSE